MCRFDSLAAMWPSMPFVFDMKLRQWINGSRHFEERYCPHLQRSICPTDRCFFTIYRPLKMRALRCLVMLRSLWHSVISNRKETLNRIFFATAPIGPGPPHSRDFQITRDASHSVGLLWTSNHLVTGTYTWQHATLTRERHPCPQWVSKPQFQQASGRRRTP
jgi:hypothetical protein